VAVQVLVSLLRRQKEAVHHQGLRFHALWWAGGVVRKEGEGRRRALGEKEKGMGRLPSRTKRWDQQP
jgi:hypothetical protein